MKNVFAGIAVVLGIAGFVLPGVWFFAIISGIIAICSSPGGTRPDGKPRSGGLLGSMMDDMAVSRNMRKCPYCMMMIDKRASKCPHCQEEVSPVMPRGKICAVCGQENVPEATGCLSCGNPV
jgi:hypothetical protein